MIETALNFNQLTTKYFAINLYAVKVNAIAYCCCIPYSLVAIAASGHRLV
jgi:hypothetical protein